MIFIVTALILGIIFIGLLLKSDKASPLFLFVTIWEVIIVLYQLKMFGIFEVSDFTQDIIVTGVFSFVIGYFVVQCIYKPQISNRSYDILVDDYNTEIKIIIILVYVASAPFYIEQLKTMFSMGGALDILKIMLATGETDSGGIVMQYFVRPMEYIIVAISAYYLIYNKKEKFIVSAGIILSILKILATGSKAALVFYVLALFTVYISKGKFLFFSKINRGAKNIMLIMTFAVLVYMALNGNVLRSLYYYLCGCVPMLDKVLVTETAFYGAEMTYGNLSFNGVIRFFYNALEFIGINVDNQLFDVGYQYIAKFEYTKIVGENQQYNAFTTLFSYFYIDFGFFGVVMMSLVFGMVSCFIYKKAIASKKLNYYILLILLNYSIVFSMVRFQLAHTVIATAFIYSVTIIPATFFVMNKIRIKK